MNTKTTVLIADNHPVVLAGLTHYLERRGVEVVGNASSVDGLFSELRRYAVLLPDIVITGYHYNGEADGLRVIERIRRAYPRIKIVVFASARPIGAVRQVLAKGADAFVSKATELQFLMDACHAVLSGAKYVDPATDGAFVPAARNGIDERAEDPESRLSPREREVLRLLTSGCTLSEIAEQFHRSVKTISVQKCSAMTKLGLNSELELAMYLVNLKNG